jgi:hypothetical protein
MANKPTHFLCIKRKDDKRAKFDNIGCGWINDKGQIKLKVNIGVVLSWRDLDDLTLYLFPNKDK